MSKKDNQLFNPVRVRKKGSLKWLILGFVVFSVIFGAVTFFYLSAKIDNFGMNNVLSLFEKDSNESTLSSESEGSATFLLMSVSSTATQETGEREIYFLTLAHADMKSGMIKFCPIPVQGDYIDSYKKGAEEEVVIAVEKKHGIKIDRYISSSENTFALAINYMDGLEYNVPERVEYRTKDLILILTPGKQTIKGESLVKYLKFLKETNPSKQGEIFSTMVNLYITPENMENALALYKGVLGELSANSNISYVDVADNLKNIEFFAKKSGEKTKTVNSVEELF